MDSSSRQDPSDAVLLQRIREGDDTALNTLVSRHRDALYRFCCRLVSNHHDAEDICQESLTRALAHVDSIQTGYAFRSWLYTTARNLSTDAYRRRGRTFPLLEQDNVPASLQIDSPEDRVELGEERQTVAEALGRLRKNYQRVLMLREIEGLSYAQIARELKVSQSAVEALLFRARRRLREEYSKGDAKMPGIAVLAGIRGLLLRLGAQVSGSVVAKVAVTASFIGLTVASFRTTLPAQYVAQARHVSPTHRAIHTQHVAMSSWTPATLWIRPAILPIWSGSHTGTNRSGFEHVRATVSRGPSREHLAIRLAARRPILRFPSHRRTVAALRIRRRHENARSEVVSRSHVSRVSADRTPRAAVTAFPAAPGTAGLGAPPMKTSRSVDASRPHTASILSVPATMRIRTGPEGRIRYVAHVTEDVTPVFLPARGHSSAHGNGTPKGGETHSAAHSPPAPVEHPVTKHQPPAVQQPPDSKDPSAGPKQHTPATNMPQNPAVGSPAGPGAVSVPPKDPGNAPPAQPVEAPPPQAPPPKRGSDLGVDAPVSPGSAQPDPSQRTSNAGNDVRGPKDGGHPGHP